MVILDHFEESDQPEVNGECCDVCVKSDSTEMVECKEEMVAIMRAVMDNPNKGEKKVTSFNLSNGVFLHNLNKQELNSNVAKSTDC